MTRGSATKAKPKPESDVTKQWVVIAPESCSLGVKSEENQGAEFIPLPHPYTGKPTLFLFSADRKTVCEVVRFQDEPRSWFLGETVQKDGCLYMLTPIDPVFLALPFLVAAAEASSRYSILDQILVSDEYPGINKLLEAGVHLQMPLVCNVKGSGEYQGYRLDEDKLQLWLKAKVNQVITQLKASNVNVSSGAKVATFVRSSSHGLDATQEQYCSYAAALVASYLSEKHGDMLKAIYPAPASKVVSPGADGEQETSQDADSLEPAAKRARRGSADDSQEASATGVVEDYRDHNAKTSAKKAPTQTVAQKRLSKVDKSGMKSMTSFFSKKPAKK